MFKAKLIKSRRGYYRLYSRQTLYQVLPGFFMGILIAAFNDLTYFSLWTLIAGLGFYAAAIFVLYDNQKLLNAMKGEQQIEVDNSGIRIKSKKGALKETIDFENVERIVISKTFTIVTDTGLKAIIKGFKGKVSPNYIIVHQNGESRRFDFELDSNYMMIQLNKAIKSWKDKGYLVEKEGEEQDLPISGYENLTDSDTHEDEYEERIEGAKNRFAL